MVAERATIVAMRTEPIRSVRDHLSELVDVVAREQDRVFITKNGRTVAVLMSVEDLESLEETVDILRDPNALRDIREGDEADARGETFTITSIRDLRA